MMKRKMQMKMVEDLLGCCLATGGMVGVWWEELVVWVECRPQCCAGDVQVKRGG